MGIRLAKELAHVAVCVWQGFEFDEELCLLWRCAGGRRTQKTPVWVGSIYGLDRKLFLVQRGDWPAIGNFAFLNIQGLIRVAPKVHQMQRLP